MYNIRRNEKIKKEQNFLITADFFFYFGYLRNCREIILLYHGQNIL